MKTLHVKPTSTDSFASFWLQFNKDSELPNPKHVFKEQIANIQNFALGNSYWLISSIPEMKVVAAGGALEEMTGRPGELWLGLSPESCFSHFYHDDIPYIHSYVIKTHKYLHQIPSEERAHIRASMYAKRISNDESIRWYCGQIPSFFFDKQDNLIYFLAVWSDISHLISGLGLPFLTILNTASGECKTSFCCKPFQELEVQGSSPTITKREQEIISHLAKGRSSKQIAGDLKISKNTVDNHRQNILKKLGASATAEIISISIQNGLI